MSDTTRTRRPAAKPNPLDAIARAVKTALADATRAPGFDSMPACVYVEGETELDARAVGFSLGGLTLYIRARACFAYGQGKANVRAVG